MMHVTDRVTEGVCFVREHYGHDWFNHVDTDTLLMTDARNCILGQLEKHKMGAGNGFYQALNRLGLSHTDADDMGFTIESVDRGNEWEPLTYEWKRRIRNLRESYRNAPEVLTPEREPVVWVDLTAHTTSGPVSFPLVAGINFKDDILSFENEDGRLFYVPNVTHWTTDASEV